MYIIENNSKVYVYSFGDDQPPNEEPEHTQEHTPEHTVESKENFEMHSSTNWMLIIIFGIAILLVLVLLWLLIFKKTGSDDPELKELMPSSVSEMETVMITSTIPSANIPPKMEVSPTYKNVVSLEQMSRDYAKVPELNKPMVIPVPESKSAHRHKAKKVSVKRKKCTV